MNAIGSVCLGTQAEYHKDQQRPRVPLFRLEPASISAQAGKSEACSFAARHDAPATKRKRELSVVKSV